MIKLNKEQKSIEIIKEAEKKFKKIAVMFSLGKDSTVLLHLIYKAYGKIPFDVIFLDNCLEFKEQYKFLHEKEKELNFKAISINVMPTEIKLGDGTTCCGLNKANANKELEKKYDALMIAIRKDESDARKDEKYFREKRIHPILDWTELDIWNYIKENNIKVSPLYFAKNGKRYRSLGCSNCSSPIKSNAKTVDEIINEIKKTKGKEREGRSKEKEIIMKKLRDLGYM